MRGSIRKRGRTYTWYLFVPDPATGKPRQRSRGGYRTKRECQAGLNDALAALRAGTFVEMSRRTIGSFVRDEWLPVMELNLRPTTWTTYQGPLNAYVIPTLGAVELQRLTPGHLSVLYRELLTSGRRHRPGGLAPKTVRNVHVLLHRVLKDAVRWGYVVRNVADAADPPKVKPAELQVWSPGQLRAFLAHVQGDRQYAAWLLAATTGMRRGELLGLRWVDVDLDAARIAVRQPRVVADHAVHVSEPKTARSRRSIALDPVTVAALRQHQARQAADRAAVGPAYVDSGLVFTHPDGSPIHPQRFSDWFRQHIRAAGLPAIRLHDLRHSYATAALAAGIPAKVVSERLGHATIAITMDTYSHVLPGLDERAATTVARLILEGYEAEPSASIDNPLTTGHVVPSTLDFTEGGEARNARSDAQRRRTGIEPA
jgi:integrase